QPGLQVFPGMVGLPEPWATRRCTPLTHSFCQHVVASERPLIIDDATRHPWVRDSLAIAELGVRAYAGIPLSDDAGNVLGSLCAIDVTARTWSQAELVTLTDLARSCSLELRLRLARHDAQRERGRHDRLEESLRVANTRSETLLAASQSLAQAGDLSAIRARLDTIMSSDLTPTYISLVVHVGDGLLRRVPSPTAVSGREDSLRWAEFELTAPLPSARAVREQRTVHYGDRESFDRDNSPAVRELARGLGVHALIVTPLLDQRGAIGALVLGWDRPGLVNPLDQLMITSIAGYVTHAVTRAEHLRHRTSVAHELQRAMLTPLPLIDGVSLGARYQPADAREEVGGDWYDVTALPATGCDPEGITPGFAVTVGDITGHDMHAATVMGQVRSMLRQGTWDHPGQSPAAVLTALEQACAGIGLGASGSLVHGHLRRLPDRPGHWLWRWVNAGHPPPLHLRPGSPARLLEGHGILFGFGHLTPRDRCTHEVVLEPGSTLLLYTDGLVERRRADIDQCIEELRTALSGTAGPNAQDTVDLTVKALTSDDDNEDDIVALAICPHPS
ncbi:MAG TPA: SpoIIE family protein phosphatase, partial [Pseudonocardia sp.]|nr:SpoIIE family protein phosphatase [Pseudonocardia sp.]